MIENSARGPVYNYTHFIGDDDFEGFRAGPQVGSKAPDGDLIDARTGKQVRLSDYWQGRDLLIEFGSLT